MQQNIVWLLFLSCIYHILILTVWLLLFFLFQSCIRWYELLIKSAINPKHLTDVKLSTVFQKNSLFQENACFHWLICPLTAHVSLQLYTKPAKTFNKMLRFSIFISKLSAFQEMWKAALLKHFFFLVLSGKLEALFCGLSHLFRKAYNSPNCRYEALCDSWSQTEKLIHVDTNSYSLHIWRYFW